MPSAALGPLVVFPKRAIPGSGRSYASRGELQQGEVVEQVELERGRELFALRRWAEAYESLSRADDGNSLGPGDVELLARTSYMLGRDDGYVEGLERAHHAHLKAGNGPRAALCAFWIGHNLAFRGEMAPARGWFARGQRLLDREGTDRVEHGYLQLATLFEHLFSSDAASAEAVARGIIEIAERFGDPDLAALGMMEQGHALVRLGETDQGLRLVDETMIAVTTGELSPIVAGIVYCNTITFCRSRFEVRRAREWTVALTRWCGEQPQMVAHNGQCLVHRAEMMTLEGRWPDALDELHRLEGRYTDGVLNKLALGDAAYQRAEVQRLRGEFEQAEAAFREASERGRQPQPGLALLRLAQGRHDDAAGAIRRAVAETTRWPDRAVLLPSYVRIMIRVKDTDAARSACRELQEIAARHDSESLQANAWHATGATALAVGDPEAALLALRQAWQALEELGAIHEAALARVQIGLCCRAMGDEDSAILEWAAARHVFAEIGAAPDLAELVDQAGLTGPVERHGLTSRELEVMRLVAAGLSNRDVASQLFISEHTVARHLQNIFSKLDVSSRTEASAFAHEHGLLGVRGQD